MSLQRTSEYEEPCLRPIVSGFKGLSIMVDTVPEATVEEILQARERALEEGADLLERGENIRSRPIFSTA